MVRRLLARGLGEYGMVAVLLLLCGYYAWATLERRPVEGAEGGRDCAAQLLAGGPRPGRVAVVAGDTAADRAFAAEVRGRLAAGGVATVSAVPGDPPSARRALARLAADGAAPDAIAAAPACAAWVPRVLEQVPAAAAARVATPRDRRWPTFLTARNLLNVANQIVIFAVVAAGMTLVILTGGIDLSVGSGIALSAVVVAALVRRCGGTSVGPAALVACGAAAVAVGGGVGAFSGAMVTAFRVPPFIATLAMMQVASGLAYKLSDGATIHDFPARFNRLGGGVGPLGVPNAVLVMLGLFAAAQVVMSRTRFGRYVYAVGGNAEAARLSGVGVGSVLMAVYVASGLAAGLGGVVLASQLNSGAPTYGTGYELYVIAAVVVGGTSLAGGEGRILMTLVGALVIAVIQNGMNLTGVDPYSQKIVLGLVILGAVLLDQLKRRPWRLPPWLRPAPAVAGGPAPIVGTRPVPSPGTLGAG